MNVDLISGVERLDHAMNRFLKEAIFVDPRRPITHELLFLILDAFGTYPIGESDSQAADALPAEVRAERLPQLRQKARVVADLLSELLGSPAPTYCAASYWDATESRRHVVSRRQSAPGDVVQMLRNAYCFYVLSHRGAEAEPRLPTTVQFIADTRIVIRLAYERCDEGNLPDSFFRLSAELCDEILEVTELVEFVESVMPEAGEEALAIQVANQMRNVFLGNERIAERPVREYITEFRTKIVARPQHKLLASDFDIYLTKRLGKPHGLSSAQLVFMLATSILYNRYVCPARYLYPTLVPVESDISILTVGTDAPLTVSAQLIIHAFARNLFQGFLRVDREHSRAADRLKKEIERTAAQLSHNLTDPLARTVAYLGLLKSKLQQLPPTQTNEAHSQLIEVSPGELLTGFRPLGNDAPKEPIADFEDLDRAKRLISRALRHLDVFSWAFDTSAGFEGQFHFRGRLVDRGGVTNLPALVRDMVEELLPIGSERRSTVGCRWQLEELPASLTVRGHESGWSVFLYILLTNASRQAKGGIVRVTLERDSERDDIYCLVIANDCDRREPDVLLRMQEILRRGDQKLDPAFMGLTTASDALRSLGISSENVSVRWGRDERLEVRLDRIASLP